MVSVERQLQCLQMNWDRFSEADNQIVHFLKKPHWG